MTVMTSNEHVTCNPYIAGDSVMVEIDGTWVPASVCDITLDTTSARFGLRWRVLVRTSEGYEFEVRCDDDGRNHTHRKQVTPAPYVESWRE